MTEDDDLAVFARTWRETQDGWSGRRYGEALEAAGRVDEAAEVYREVWRLGYPAGLVDLAWLEWDREEPAVAVTLMVRALPELDDEDVPLARGVLGHMLWCGADDPDAEPHLRAGQEAYPSARADLAHLLLATDRGEEARTVLRTGVERGETVSMLPLANLLDEDGATDAAEALYRRAFDLGDAFSAWNLSLLLLREGRDEEAEQWRWKAAQGGDEVAIRSLVDGADETDEP